MYRLSVFTIMIISMNGFSQNTFHLRSSIGTQKAIVNEKMVEIDSVGISIETHYPGFDSIQFLREYRDTAHFVLCNFKPDSSYVLIGACCGSTDITTSSKLEQVENKLLANRVHLDTAGFEAELFMAQEILWDRPTFTFRLTETLEDTVWGWSSDAACFSLVFPITEEPLNYGTPEKCFYWTNINHLHFFKQKNLGSWIGGDGVEYYNWPEFETATTVASQAVRFFDDHHFLVTVNPKTEELYIRYDD